MTNLSSSQDNKKFIFSHIMQSLIKEAFNHKKQEGLLKEIEKNVKINWIEKS